MPKEVSSRFEFDTAYEICGWEENSFENEASKIVDILPKGAKFVWLTTTNRAFAVQIFLRRENESLKIFPTLNIMFQLEPPTAI